MVIRSRIIPCSFGRYRLPDGRKLVSGLTDSGIQSSIAELGNT
jgi:hypothetical protein